MCIKSSIHLDCSYNCEEVYQSTNLDSYVCVGNMATYPGLTTLWELVVYPCQKNSKWHARECLLGECENCGVENLPIYLVEKDALSNSSISWKQFSLKKIVTKKGKEKKKLKLIFKSTSSIEFIDYLKPKLQYFVHHNFVSCWQDWQFKKRLKHFLTNIIVSMVNFAKNYNFEVWNEVQKMH